MENQSTFSTAGLLHSRIFLLAAAGIILLLLVGSVTLMSLLSAKKPKLVPINKEAVYASDKVIVQFSEAYLPALPGRNPKWDSLYGKLKNMGVVRYEKEYQSTEKPLNQFYILYLKPGSDVVKVREEVYKLKEVKSSDPDYYLSTQATANDPSYPGMWDLQKIDIEHAWNITKGSDSVTIAVIDTGINYNHPDFEGRTIIKGHDYSTCDSTLKELQAAGGKCTKPKPEDNDPMDNMGHGTHVAGTIGAMTNNGEGVAGINWNVTLMAVKVLGAGGAGGEGVGKGIEYAVDHGARVINMSLGGTQHCDANYQSVIDYARSHGVVVVVAAGNSNVDAYNFAPASCNGVITVGATGPSDERAAYSNYGSLVTLAAPGGNDPAHKGSSGCTVPTCINSTWGLGGYAAIEGTSMASPHVAGVAGLILAQNPTYSPDQVKQCLVSSGDAISTDKAVGNKRLNAYNALNGCSSSSISPTSAVTPSVSITQSPSPSQTAGAYYIEGKLYKDLNKNLKPDPGEPPLAGVTLTLSGPVDRPSVTTGASGEYSFSLLSAGSYTMKGLVNGSQVVEYRFPLTQQVSSLEFNVPLPESVAAANPSVTSAPTATPGGPTSTPTPTPVVLYSCHERTTNRTVNNKVVQLKYLECNPK
jgi:subtilisin family serine protease